MNQSDVRIAFSSELIRLYLDFLLSFNYPLRVIPFKVIAKASRKRLVFEIPSKHKKC